MKPSSKRAPPGSWLDDEPGLAELRRDARRALARAKTRWISTLLIATALTAAVVHHRVTHPPRFDATVVVSVTELGFDETTKPPSSGELDKHVHEVFLARSTLVELIEELDLYPDKMTPDPSLALEAMGDDLEVRVGQNYFDAQRTVGLPVRSARIVIAYSGRSPEHAHALVRLLGQRFTEEQTRRRRSAARAAAFRADTQEKELLDHVRASAAKQAALGLLMDSSPLAVAQLGGATDASKALEAQLQGVSRERADNDLRGSLEEQRLGMRFDVVDVGRRPTPALSETQSLGVTGFTAFALILPLSALGMGILPARTS